MAGVLVIVAPGQGAQTPGFLEPWLALPDFAGRLADLAEVCALPLAEYGTTGDADTIRDTRIAQPLLVGTGLAAARVLDPDGHLLPAMGAVAGHSVGEVTAAAVCGALSDAEAMALVRARGDAMADAAAVTATGMTAVLGGDRDQVLAAVAGHGLVAANDNGPGQLVAAGTEEQLDAFSAAPPPRARLTRLSVAGAFHTPHMAPATARVRLVADSLAPSTPRPPLVSNADGSVVADGADVVTRLVTQIANPVRWDLCMTTMLDLGVTGLLELPPAGTLTGIARRAMKGVATFAWKTPDQLEEAREFCAGHLAMAAGVPS